MQSWQNRIIGLEYHKPGDIAEHPYQWRAHTKAQIAAIKGILAEVGIAGALLAYHSPDNDLALTAIDGHLRKSLEAGVAWPVLVLDVDDAEALKLLASFDPIGAMAQVDLSALQKVLERVETENTALQAMLEGLAEDAGIASKESTESPTAQTDKAEELRGKWGVELNQIWTLPSQSVPGEDHRIMCGDSTDAKSMEKLMDGRWADMVFTDPPYLMEYEGALSTHGEKRDRHGGMMGDKMSLDEGDFFLSQIAAMIRLHCRGAFYICFHRLKIDRIMNALTANELNWRALLIWYKNNHNLSNSAYKSIYEPIIYGWNKIHEWYGSRGETDVIEIEQMHNVDHVVRVGGGSAYFRLGGSFYKIQRIRRPKAYIDVGERIEFAFYDTGTTDVWQIRKTKVNNLHPTMKPVELIQHAIRNSSTAGAIVADWFLGSGTTLIACEREGRIGYGADKDPRYVAVAIQRLVDVGLKARLVE